MSIINNSIHIDNNYWPIKKGTPLMEFAAISWIAFAILSVCIPFMFHANIPLWSKVMVGCCQGSILVMAIISTLIMIKKIFNLQQGVSNGGLTSRTRS